MSEEASRRFPCIGKLLNSSIFREYDVRGLEEANDELTHDNVVLITRAFGQWLIEDGIDTCVLGRDCRRSSSGLAGAATEGLLSSGVDVVSIGLVTTPMLYWSQQLYETDGGLMITASHNPAGWNGLKLSKRRPLTLDSDEIQELYQRALRCPKPARSRGRLHKVDSVLEEYVRDIIKLCGPVPQGIKLVINTGNGTAGIVVPLTLREVGAEVIPWNTEVDETFPLYTANPSDRAMMTDTGDITKRTGASLGFAFDADGDRLGVVKADGETVYADLVFALIAKDYLLESGNAGAIVFDVKCSEALPETIAAYGGRPVMWKTGHSHIKHKMFDVGAELAGEASGHFFFRDRHYGFDDALYSALRLLQVIERTSKPLEDMLAELPSYATTPSYHATCPDESKYHIVDDVTERFRKDGHRVVDLSGARVYMLSGWGLVRASSNLPSLVLRFEARTLEDVRRIEDTFRRSLRLYPEVSQDWTIE